MLKQICKRTLSALLVVALVFTTFFIFDPSAVLPEAEAVATAKDGVYPAMFFVAPEAIYLKPRQTSYSAAGADTFQLYVNNNLDFAAQSVTPATAASTTGNIYFYYPNATNVSIQYKWQSSPGTTPSQPSSTITIAGSAKAPNSSLALADNSVKNRGYYSANITAGTAPSYAAATTGMYICWIINYTDRTDNEPKQAYAYTYVYKPYVTPVGVAWRAKCTRGGDSFNSGVCWMNGFHGISDTRDRYAQYNTSAGLQTFSNSAGGTAVGDLYAQFPDYWQRGWTESSPGDMVPTSQPTGMMKKGFTYVEGTHGYCSGDETQINWGYSGTGTITVDSSRYGNMNQVPNVSLGIMLTDGEGSHSGAWFLSNFSGTCTYDGSTRTDNFFDYWNNKGDARIVTTWNAYRGSPFKSVGNYDSRNTDVDNGGVKVNTTWNKTPTAGLNKIGAGIMLSDSDSTNLNGISDSQFNIGELRCNVTLYNKGDLRTAYYNAIKKFPVAYQYNGETSFTNFLNLFRAVAKELCKVDGSWANTTVNGTNYTSASGLASALNTATNGFSPKTTSSFTVTANHLSTSSGNPAVIKASGTTSVGTAQAAETATVKYGGSFDVHENTYAGYNYKTELTTMSYGTESTKLKPFIFYDWAQSGSAAIASGSATYDGFSDNTASFTCTGADFKTEYIQNGNNGNIKGSGYYYCAVEPGTNYTIRYDYAGTGDPEFWVVYYDSNGAYKTAEWVYCSTVRPRTGSTSTWRTYIQTFAVPSGYNYICLVFSCYPTTGSLKYRNVVITREHDRSNKTFNFYYEPISYTLTLDANSGSCSTSSISYTIESTTTLPNATRTGYTHSGWKSSSTFGNWSSSTTYGKNQNVKGKYGSGTLKAQWSPTDYTITYNTDGGTAITAKTYNIESTDTLPSASGKTGYSFSKWQVTTTGGNWTAVNTYYNSGTSLTGKYGNVTLKAIWTINQYYLDLNGELDDVYGGGISPYGTADITVGGTLRSNDTSDYYTKWDYNTSYTVNDIKANRGYRYVGLGVNGSGVSGAALTGNIGAGGATTNVILEFATNKYSIVYDGNTATSGATPAAHNNIYYTNNQGKSGWTTSITTAANPFQKTGYSFAGWNSKDDGTGTTWAASTPVTCKEIIDAQPGEPGNGGTVTLYAKWTPNNYQTLFDLNYGSAPKSDLFAFNASNGKTGKHTGSVSGITYSYDPATETITLNGTATGGTGDMSLNTIATEAGDYILAVEMISGSATFSSSYCCLVFEPSMNGSSPASGRKNYDFKFTGANSGSKKITFTNAGEANQLRFWLWCDTANGGAASFTNAKYKVHMYKASSATTKYLPDGQMYTMDAKYSPLPTPAARTGWTFNGWFTAASGGTQITTNTTVTATNRTLYAHWTAYTYTVAYHGNGATGGSTASSSHTYDTAKNLTSNGFSRVHTVYYKNPDGTTAYSTNGTSTYTFANWSSQGADETSEAHKDMTSTSGSNDFKTINFTVQTGDVFVVEYDAKLTNAAGTGAGTGTGLINYFYNNTSTNVQCSHVSRISSNGKSNIASSPRTGTNDGNNTIAPADNGGAYVHYRTTYTFGTAGNTCTKTLLFRAYNGSHVYVKNIKVTKVSGTNIYTNGQSVTNLTATNGGTVDMYANWTPQSVTLPTPTKVGYTFGGWYYETTLTTSAGAAGANFTPIQDTTLYAKWTAKTYTVTFYDRGTDEDHIIGTQTITYDEATNLTAVATLLSDAGKTAPSSSDGWSFKGWATGDNTNTTTYNNSASVTNLCTGETGSTNINLYAVWQRDVTAYTGRGSGNWASSTVKQYWRCLPHTNSDTGMPDSEGRLYTTLPEIKAVTDWNRNGWRGDANAQSPVWSKTNTGTYSFTIYPGYSSAHNNYAAYKTFYSIYARQVTFYQGLNSSSALCTATAATQFMNSGASATGSTVRLTGSGSATPALSHIDIDGNGTNDWTALGWRTDKTATTAQSGMTSLSANATITGDYTAFYAVYKRTVNLAYNPNGGTGTTMTVTTGTQYYNTGDNGTNGTTTTEVGATTGASITSATCTYTYTGHHFLGWMESASASTYKTAGQAFTVDPAFDSTTVTKTVYAKWDANTYAINYTMNGGTNVSTNPTSATYGTKFEVKAPSYPGYTFRGWTVTSGLDTSTAKWGTSASTAPATAITASTLLVNGTNSVYLNNVCTTYPNGAITLTANWQINAYTITVNTNGGTIPTITYFPTRQSDVSLANTSNDAKVTASNVNGSAVTYSPLYNTTMTLALPTKAGYEFDGYTLGTNNPGTLTSSLTGNSTLVVKGAATITANWTGKTYSITYKHGTTTLGTQTGRQFGGTGATTNLLGQSGLTQSAIPSDYTLVGWTKTAGSLTATYTTSNTCDDAANEGASITLYAVWKRDASFKYYDANGTVQTTPKPLYYGVTTAGANNYTVTTAASQTGKPSSATGTSWGNILGWRDDDTNGAAEYGFNTVVTNNSTLTYYAVYSRTITFGYNGNTNTAGTPPTTHAGTTQYASASKKALSGYTDQVKAKPTELAKAGYEFAGWNTKADGSGTTKQAGDNYTYTPAVGEPATGTLYAKWDLLTYDITYLPNKPSAAPDSFAMTHSNPATYTYEQAVSIGEATAPGYTFTGWSTTSSGSNKQLTISWAAHATTGDKTYYANWTAKTYTLTFALNGGSLAAGGGFTANTDNQTKTVTYASTYGAAASGKTWPNDPTKAGYTFAGWKNGSTTFTSGGKVLITDDTTITAQWSSNRFYIKFNANGVTATMPSNMTANYNTQSNALPSVSDTAGWAFQGWTKTQGGTTVDYAAGAKIPAADTITMYNTSGVGLDGVYNLYAVWKKTLTATFIDYTGTSKTTRTESKTVYNGNSATITPPTQNAVSGWTAAGWTTSTAKDAAGSTANVTITANTTYYGMYTQAVTLTYNKNTTETVTDMPSPLTYTSNRSFNSYTGMASTSNIYNPSFTLYTAKEPKRSGYDYIGWNTNSTPNPLTGDTNATVVTLSASTTYYAIWQPHVYTIEYNYNGGGAVSGKTYPTSGTYGKDVRVPAPAYTGRTFKGWTVTQGLVTSCAKWGTAANPTNPVSGDTTLCVNGTNDVYFRNLTNLNGVTVKLTANWDTNTYRLHYDFSDGGDFPLNATYPSESTDITYGTVVTIPAPTYAGYTFTGWTVSGMTTSTAQWATSANGNNLVAGTGVTASSVCENGPQGAVYFKNLSSTNGATVTLKATWVAHEFQFAFSKNGVGTDANMPDPMDAMYDVESDALPEPEEIEVTVNGLKWTFQGWALSDDKTLVIYEAGDVIPADEVNEYYTAAGVGGTYTLYAVWTREIQAIFKDYQGTTAKTRYGILNGTTSTNKKIVYNGDTTTTATFKVYTENTYSYTNGGTWTGAGWTTATGAGATAEKANSASETVTISATTTYYGLYQKAVTVTYEPHNGTAGTASDTKYYKRNSAAINTVLYPSFTLTTCTRDGYTFNGWWTAETGGTKYGNAGEPYALTESNTGSPAASTTAVTMHAQWTAKTAQVTFDPKGGTFTAAGGFSAGTTSQTKTVTYDKTYGTADGSGKEWPTITRLGYTLAGWYTTDAASGGTKIESSTVSHLTAAQTLYARWTLQSYEITYVAEGAAIPGTPGSTYTTTYNITTAVKLPAAATGKTGYTFNKWVAERTNASDGLYYNWGSGTEYNAGATFNAGVKYGSVRMVASWTKNTFTLTFDTNGVTTAMPSNITLTYDTALSTLPDPTQTTVTSGNYTWTFLGWGNASSDTASEYRTSLTTNQVNAMYNTSGVGKGGTFKLYAIWRREITVTFVDYNGSTTQRSRSGIVNGTSADTVRYAYNGDTAATATFKVVTEGTLPSANYVGTWTGAGWTTETGAAATAAVGNSASNTVTVNYPTTYYGLYQKAVTVTYAPHGGTAGAASDTQYYKRNSASIGTISYPSYTLTTCTRDGYTFAGWWTAETGGTQYGGAGDTYALTASNTGSPATTTTAITMHAHWTANTAQVTFNAKSGTFKAENGFSAGTANQTKTVTYDSTYGAADSSGKGWPVVEREGYTLEGWYTTDAASGGTKIESSTVSHLTAAQTLYARWTVNSYTLTIAGSEGCGEAKLIYGTAMAQLSTAGTASAEVPYGTNIAVSNHDPASGYKFVKWTKQVGTGAAADFDGSNFTMPAANVTITAVFTLDRYNITIKPEGGSVSVVYFTTAIDTSTTTTVNAETTLSVIRSTTMELGAPTRTGYRFNHWTATTYSTNLSTLTGNKARYTVGVGADTLTASWDANAYTITYNAGTGTGTAVTQNCTYDANVTLYTNEPDNASSTTVTRFTKAGYAFVGWNTASDGTGTDYTAGGTLTKPNFVSAHGGNYNLYAKWEIRTFNLTIQTNTVGGTVTATYGGTTKSATKDHPQTIGVTYNTAVSVAATAANGYAFDSWEVYTGLASAPAQSGSITMPANAVVLQAKFVERTYTLHYKPEGGTMKVGGSTVSGYDQTGVKYTQTATLVNPTRPGAAFTLTKAGYELSGWKPDYTGEPTIVPGGTYNQSTDTHISSFQTVVNLKAVWTAKTYMLKFDDNSNNLGFAELKFVEDAEWIEETEAYDMNTQGGDFIQLPSAYTEDGGYYYVYDAEDPDALQTRFAVGWTLTPYFDNEAPTVDFTYGQEIELTDLAAAIDAYAVKNAGTGVYEATLYTVWTANYAPLESALSSFQSRYMRFDEETQETARTYIIYDELTGEPIEVGFYAEAPANGGVLPADAATDPRYAYDADYESLGREAMKLNERAGQGKADAYPGSPSGVYTDVDKGMYTWIVGGLTDTSAEWSSYASSAANDFTDVSGVNEKYCDAAELIVLDPAAAFAAGELQAQSAATMQAIDDNAAMLMYPYEEEMFMGLELKDADPNYYMSAAEMTRYTAEGYTTAQGVPLSGAEHCTNAASAGYTPDSDVTGFLVDSGFAQSFDERYPNCGGGMHAATTVPSERVAADHCFNALIALCDAEFRNYCGANVDPKTVNVNTLFANESSTSLYTKASVRALYELVYGTNRNGLYYDVYDTSGNIKLKRPSQFRINDIVGQIASKRHELVIKGADYSEFTSLLTNYLKDTWGSRITDLTSASIESFEVLSRYFMQDENYETLSDFLNMYFGAPGRLRSANDPATVNAETGEKAYVALSVIEQDYINGRNDTPRDGVNEFYDIAEMSDANDVPLIEKYGFADETICDKLCDLIDALQPGPGNYINVYRVLYDSVSTLANGNPISRPLYETNPYPGNPTTTKAAWDKQYKDGDEDEGYEAGIQWDVDMDSEWLEHYYTTDSVAEFQAYLEGIEWGYTRVEQGLIDGSESTSIVNELTEAVRALTPKIFRIALVSNYPQWTGVEDYTRFIEEDAEITRYNYHYDSKTTNANGGVITLQGLTFLNWNTQANGTGTTYEINAQNYLPEIRFRNVETVTESEEWPNGDTVEFETFYLYAQWDNHESTLVFDMDGGRVTVQKGDEEPAVVTSGDTTSWTGLFEQALAIGVPTKHGYTFVNWTYTRAQDNPNATFTYNTQNQTAAYTFGDTKNVIDYLKANWSANTYTLTYEAGEGTGESVQQSYRYDSTVTLYTKSQVSFTREGYELDGWTAAKASTVTSTTYGLGQRLTKPNFVDDEVTRMIAHWAVKSYNLTVTNDGHGTATASWTGNTNKTTGKVAYTDTVTLTATASTGYEFDRWTGITVTNNTFTMPHEDVTVTAHFRPKTFVVTFDANEGTFTAGNGFTAANDNTKTVSYDSTYGAADTNSKTWPATPERRAYSFDGWFTARTGGTEITASTAVTTLYMSGQTLYAHWTLSEFTVTFDAGEHGTLSGAYAGANNTKLVILGSKYGAEDRNGKTWPADPTLTIETAGGDVDAQIFFDGWYLDETTKVTENTDVSTIGDHTLTAHYKEVEVEELVDAVEFTLNLNANDYTMEALEAVDAAYEQLMTRGATEENVAALEAAVAALDENIVTNDAHGAKIEVFETGATVDAQLANFDADTRAVIEEAREGKGEISYVFPGKAYYTYYCYTNSLNPFILVNTSDILGANGRVSYPTKVAASASDATTEGTIGTQTGTVLSGWMKYTVDADDSIRSADYEIGSYQVENPYKNELSYAGSRYGGKTGYNYYRDAGYIMLTPTFSAPPTTASTAKQYAKYTFTVYDDSYEPMPADAARLAGAAGYGDFANEAGTSLATGNAYTPAHTVTIFVEFLNTMYYDAQAGEYVADMGGQTAGGSGNYLNIWNDCELGENGPEKWVTKDYLYRHEPTVALTDFVVPLEPGEDGKYTSYLGSDPIYGQNDVGSFYYLMSRNDDATAVYWTTYDAKYAETKDAAAARKAAARAAMPVMETKIKADMQGGTQSKLRTQMLNMQTQAVRLENAPTEGAYVAWPYDSTKTIWSTQFYAPAANRNEALVYVHTYDRYGNQYTNILQRDLQDLAAPDGAMTETGKVVINENGGSGLATMKITQYAYEGSGAMLEGLEGASTELTYDSATNSFTVTGLGQGNRNYLYSLYFADHAGYSKTINFYASPDRGGSVTITVNDGSKMTGKYGEAAGNPINGQVVDPENGSEAPMTVMTVDEVPMAQTTTDTLEGASPAAAPAAAADETKQDVYSFTLNEIYTVNLFALEGRDYHVTLQSTAGGIVKTYVDGEFKPVRGGYVTIPGGSEVQIRVASQAGYELESLQMLYADGYAVDLLGAYTAEITEDVTIRAMFAKTDAKLRVTVENGTIDGREGAMVSPYSQVTVVADEAPEGKQFLYWAQGGADGAVVSYEDMYTFLVTGDTALTAVYGDAEAVRAASIVMDPASVSHITVVNGRYTLSYSGKITLPEGAQIEEFGMVLTNQSAADCTADDLVIGGAVNGVNNVKLTGDSLTENGQCKLNVNNVKAGQTRTGRLYLVVTLADGTTETIYSNTWSELTTPNN